MHEIDERGGQGNGGGTHKPPTDEAWMRGVVSAVTEAVTRAIEQKVAWSPRREGGEWTAAAGGEAWRGGEQQWRGGEPWRGEPWRGNGEWRSGAEWRSDAWAWVFARKPGWVAVPRHLLWQGTTDGWRPPTWEGAQPSWRALAEQWPGGPKWTGPIRDSHEKAMADAEKFWSENPRAQCLVERVSWTA
jgi:hypothetical protein